MSKPKNTDPIWPESQAKGQPLTDDEAARLRTHVRAWGEYVVAERAGCGRDAVVRGCAALGLYFANRNALRKYLETAVDP